MDISIIISGNLTGFSRFYASPNANEVYNEAKFDFDFRNLVTFMKDPKEKVYAISFSPKIIAVSLVTRILDSFRRPGILVVTVLIPRYQLVRGQLNQADKTAIFKLLNEVNDKFYEKNFLNGMVNQNPAVLMQDYYSDILSRYVFVNDRMQKPVNTRIDVTSPNKRIGYVAAAESSMPQYLSSVMRKSYEGYHHVFLSPHAPQNIDEPAEEILTYKVRIENGNRPVPGEVRLTDRIPNVNPEQGEKDIPDKNFTYGQVISGEAGTDIIGTIENGETIVLSYRFPKEEKTVYFRFYDGANEVPMTVVRPFIVDSNGASFNIPSDSYIFYGKEIYGSKTIKSGNPEFSIVGAGANLDLQRVQNGATININVERGWLWQFAPMCNNRPATIKPVNITLINRYNGDSRTFPNVTSVISEKLSGNQSEWEMVIESDYYKDVRVPVNTPYRLDPKPVQQRTTTTPTGNNGNGGRTVSPHNRTTSIGQNGQGLRLSKGDQHTAKDSEQIRREKNKRYMIYGAAVIVACLLVFGGIRGVKKLLGEREDPYPHNWITKQIVFSLNDDSDQPEIEAENLRYLDLKVESQSQMVTIENTDSNCIKNITYDTNTKNDSIIVKVTFNRFENSDSIIFAIKNIAIDDLTERPIPIVLSVRNSEISSYKILADGKIPSELEAQIVRLDKGNENLKRYSSLLKGKRDQIASEERDRSGENKQKEVSKSLTAASTPIDSTQIIDYSILDKWNVSTSNLTDLENNVGLSNIPKEQRDKINNIRNMIRALNNIEKPKEKVLSQLSKEQKDTIDSYFQRIPPELIKKIQKQWKFKNYKAGSLSEFKAKLENIGIYI